MSLLLEAFDNLPKPHATEDLDLWEAGAEGAIREFRELAETRYSEGTLCRILASSEDPPARRAAAFALGFVGTMRSNDIVAIALRTDSDDRVRRFAIDSLWEIWFRGGLGAVPPADEPPPRGVALAGFSTRFESDAQPPRRDDPKLEAVAGRFVGELRDLQSRRPTVVERSVVAYRSAKVRNLLKSLQPAKSTCRFP